MIYYIRCRSLENNTYRVKADSEREAEKLHEEGKSEYIDGTNKINHEEILEVYESRE